MGLSQEFVASIAGIHCPRPRGMCPRMAGSPKKRARRERVGAPPVDPLDEAAMRPELKAIPWNKRELTDEQRAQVAAAVAAHYPRNEIARALGTTFKTLKRILDDDPELTDAVDAAREAEEAELRDCLMRNAKAGSDVAALFLLKSRHGYRDRDEGKGVQVGEGGGVLLVPAEVPLDEWSAAVARQQAQFREAPPEVTDELADRGERYRRETRPREGTPGIEGLRLVKPGR